MAVALKVYSKQTEDADPGAPRALHSLFVGYGLAGLPYELLKILSKPPAGISLEASPFDLYHNLFETAWERLEPNTAALVEPITVSFSLVPTGEASFSESPIRDDYFISYIRGHESLSGTGTEETGNLIWLGKPTVVGSDQLPLEIEQRLRHLASLQTNWDSYGALPVSRVALEKTRKLLFHLYSLNLPYLPPPFIAPDPEGGLGLEWDFGPRGEVYLEISSKGQMTYVLTMGQGGHEQQRTLADDLHGIKQMFMIMQPYW